MIENILVTGGYGFIGSHFVRFLLENSNAHVTNIDALTYAANKENLQDMESHPNYRFMKIDITNKEELDQVFDKTYDTIVNFAAESHVDRSITNSESFIYTNVIGTHHLLQKVLEGKAGKMIQISTDEVYGSLKIGEDPFTEMHPLAPNNPYSASKASADLLVRSFYKTHKLPLIVTRCTNNYGPNQNPEKLIPKVIANAIANRPIPIYGNGSNVRDWIYVEDHCRAIYTVMKKGASGEVYNIGSYNEKTNLEIVKAIVHCMDKNESLITFVTDRKGHDFRYAINSSKLKNELQWAQKISFEEGIRLTVNWYLDHPNWIKDKMTGGRSS
jgi:dTDP-glucose 4,6-dehydratase